MWRKVTADGTFRKSMTDLATEVENLSNRYRIGLKDERHDTLGGAVISWLKSPISNFKSLRKPSRFDEDGEAEDIIWTLKDVMGAQRRFI